MPKTSIIVPIYIPDLTLVGTVQKCLKTLQETIAHRKEACEVILVDDGSPIKLSELRQADIAVYKAVNGGFSRAVNTGLAVASGTLLVLANDDLEFLPRWLEALETGIGFEKYSVASLATTDEADFGDAEPRFGSIWAMTRETYAAVGPLDESMRHYFSDLDYHQRLKAVGAKITKVKEFALPHVGKATYGAVDPDDSYYQADMEVYRAKYGRVD